MIVEKKQISVCGRTACKKELADVYIRIWNQPHETIPYRDYCMSCGRKIIAANPGLAYKIVAL